MHPQKLLQKIDLVSIVTTRLLSSVRQLPITSYEYFREISAQGTVQPVQYLNLGAQLIELANKEIATGTISFGLSFVSLFF